MLFLDLTTVVEEEDDWVFSMGEQYFSASSCSLSNCVWREMERLSVVAMLVGERARRSLELLCVCSRFWLRRTPSEGYSAGKRSSSAESGCTGTSSSLLWPACSSEMCVRSLH